MLVQRSAALVFLLRLSTFIFEPTALTGQTWAGLFSLYRWGSTILQEFSKASPTIG